MKHKNRQVNLKLLLKAFFQKLILNHTLTELGKAGEYKDLKTRVVWDLLLLFNSARVFNL